MHGNKVLRIVPYDRLLEGFNEHWIQSKPGALTQQHRRDAVRHVRLFLSNTEDAAGNLLRILKSVAMDVVNYDEETPVGILLRLKMCIITEHLLATRSIYALYKIHRIATRAHCDELLIYLCVTLQRDEEAG